MKTIKDIYLEALSLLLSGQIDEAAKEISRLKSLPDSEECRIAILLLQIRLQFKRSLSFDLASSKNLTTFLNPKYSFWNAEIHFVLGLSFFHRSDFKIGAHHFEMASKLYLDVGNSDKHLLCVYNTFVGQLNSGQLSIPQEEVQLLYLERASTHENNLGLLALTLRHKSHFFQRQAKLKAALGAIEQSISIMQSQSHLSDLHLALLQRADIYIDFDRTEEAEAELELIMGSKDVRVQSVAYFLSMKLGRIEQMDSVHYENLPFAWRIKYDTLHKQAHSTSGTQRARWNDQNTAIQFLNGESISLKYTSIEGQLITLLLERPHTKHELQNILWAGLDDLQLLEDRLNKTLSRVRKKLGDRLVLSKGFYQVS